VANRLDIANIALGHFGADFLQSFDEGTTLGAQVRAYYETVVRKALEDHPWRFAEAVVQLAPDAEPARPDFTYAYELPADCVTVRGVLDYRFTGGSDSFGDDSDYEDSNQKYGTRRSFQIMGRKLVTDELSPYLIYTKRSPEQGFSAHFTLAVSYLLAHYIAGVVTEDASRVAYFLTAYRQELAFARSRDGQQDTPLAVDTDALIAYHRN
jgi:hypothetical protein